MTKKRKRLLIAILVLLVICCCGVLSVFAEDLGETFTVSYADAQKHLDKITSKVWFKGDFWGLSAETNYLINNFVQAVFWIAKMIFYVCSGIYEFLMAFEGFGSYLDSALGFSSQIFKGLFGLGISTLALVLAVFFAYLAYATKGANFFRELFRNLLPIACVMVLFGQVKGEFMIKRFYDGLNENTAVIATSVSQSLKGNTITETPGISVDSGTAVLDQYFESTIWQAYKYMNSDYRNAIGANPDFVMEGHFERLVFYDSGNDDFDVNGTKISDVVGDDKNPKNKMMQAAWGKKFMFATASIVDVSIFGVMIDAVAITGMVLKVMAIIMILLGAFSGILALFPSMENVIIVWMKRFGVVLLLSGFLNIFTVLLMWLFNLLSSWLMIAFEGNMILSALTKAAIIFLIWKNRNWFVDILTSGRMRSVDNALTRKISALARKPQFKNGLGQVKKSAMSKLRVADRSVGRGLNRGMQSVGSAAALASVLAFRKLRPQQSEQENSEKVKPSYYLSEAKNKVQEASARKEEISAKMADLKAQAYGDPLMSKLPSGREKQATYARQRDEKLSQADLKHRQILSRRRQLRQKVTPAQSKVLTRNMIRQLNPQVSPEQRLANNRTKERLQKIRSERSSKAPTVASGGVKKVVNPKPRAERPAVKPTNRVKPASSSPKKRLTESRTAETPRVSGTQSRPQTEPIRIPKKLRPLQGRPKS
ncbi:DUF308 domain-containing protein [Streptococcus merionis]|uniref:DUF308 domain-containing protein n=1 Tax=Streptococcus merionis TaxID=400065 RepID=UPI003512760F